jgi:hypothetical protein
MVDPRTSKQISPPLPPYPRRHHVPDTLHPRNGTPRFSRPLLRPNMASTMADAFETPAQPRTSRFKEHTNTTSSIHPPPDNMWRDLEIEDMIEQFNEESRAPPTRKGASRTITPPDFGAPSLVGPAVQTSTPGTPVPTEGALNRFSRAWHSVFGDFRNVLGKRKAGSAEAEKENKVPDKEQQVLDERKQAADQAYQARKMAQEQGLLPTPKVFVRPTATPRAHKTPAPSTNTAQKQHLVGVFVEHTDPAFTPRTPSLYRSTSKKDLVKQAKLSKRVSALELKLASARKELHNVLQTDLPPVPPLPTNLSDTRVPSFSLTPPIFSDASADVSQDTEATTPAPVPTPSLSMGKITKKRKATADSLDETYRSIPTDSEMSDLHSEHSPEPEPPQRTIKRVKSSTSKKLKRQSSRLSKRLSRGELRKEKEEVVRVVPDGRNVPLMPSIPQGAEGKMSKVRDDGYGGLEHEMF